jgi:curved DNA-binding protein CbpA
VAPPRTSSEAAALLGLPDGAAPSEVERAWRDQVIRCHPDRVAGLHPAIQGQAEGLTVALNAARDLMLGRAPRRRPQRARG